MVYHRKTISVLFYLFVVISASAQNFSEVSSAIGIQGGFGPTSAFNSTFGGGISFSDFNGDGWDDITIATDKDSLIQFYQNNSGFFQQLNPLVSETCLVKQLLWADIDNDHDKDLFIACYEDQNRLYENTGNLALVDRTLTSGLAQANDFSVTASFGDFDRDGDLDLFVGNYDNVSEENYFYINNGNFTFTDYTVASGTSHSSMPTLASSFLDINNDLDPDLYIAVDKDFENLLFVNNGDSTFLDASSSSNTNIVVCAMNSSSGDYDCDGDVDIYVTNGPAGNVMLRNNGDLTFTDVTIEAGVGFYRTGWATSFIDYDNDSDLDMYVTTSDLFEPNALFVNNGDSTFSEPLYNQDGFEGNDIGASYCNTHGDFNHDGRIDLAVSNLSDDQFKLWQNNTVNANNWFKVDLIGQVSNRDGIGSWVEAYIDDKKLIRYTHLGDGYLGQSSDFVHFGIGEADVLDSLIIKWPSGIVDKYFNLIANQFIQVIENTSNDDPNPCPLLVVIKESISIDEDVYASMGMNVAGIISAPNDIKFASGNYAILSKAFEIQQGATLTIDQTGCPE